MQFVYILQSDIDQTLYTGCTHDIKNRLKLHNAGKVTATRCKIPYRLMYYEAYINEKDAWAREKFLKTGWGRNYIKKTLAFALRVQKN